MKISPVSLRTAKGGVAIYGGYFYKAEDYAETLWSYAIKAFAAKW